jgi:ribose/xylose/arabinose/galactoside ABC-type transport system permease subunit
MNNKINARSVRGFITGKYFIFVLLVFVFVFFAMLAPAISKTESIRNILVNASLTAISGCGMTFAITLGGFDLSVGSIMALSTCIIAKMIPTIGIPAAILLAFAVASLIGVVNGLIITKLKIQTFVATLATQVIIKGVALIYTGGLSVSVFGFTQMKAFSSARVFGIPLPVIIMMIVFLVSQFLYSRCKFGVYLRAAGSNEKAARLSAVPVDRIIIWAFVLTAATACLAGVITVSQVLTASASTGSTFALSAITVVVLGGTSLSGGSGFLGGTVVAAIMISIIENGLTLLGYSDDIQRLVIGAILIVSLTIKIFMSPSRKKGEVPA